MDNPAGLMIFQPRLGPSAAARLARWPSAAAREASGPSNAVKGWCRWSRGGADDLEVVQTV